MQLPNEPLKIAAYLRHHLTHWRSDGNGFACGFVPEPWDFHKTVQHLAAHSVEVIRDNEETREIEVSLPPSYFASFSALLAAPARRVEVPPTFYVEDIDYLHSKLLDDVPDQVLAYSDFVLLFSALRKSADHESTFGSSVSLIFLHKEKIEITCNYSIADLKRLPEVHEIEASLFVGQPHSQQRVTIFKEALLSRFPGKKKIDLREVARDLEGLAEEIRRSYQLYVSEFSFQRVRAQIEKEKMEFTARINKTFSDIQNQLLALPVALVLVGGQMKPEHSWTLPNIIVWAGALTFACLMSVLLRNQRNTLLAIFMEFDQQWRILQKDHSQIAPLFNDTYTQIRARHLHQKNALMAIDAVIALALGFSTSLLIYYSTPESIAHPSIALSGLIGILLLFGYLLFGKIQRNRAALSGHAEQGN